MGTDIQFIYEYRILDHEGDHTRSILARRESKRFLWGGGGKYGYTSQQSTADIALISIV